MIKLVKHFIKHPLFSGSAVMIGGSLFVNSINYLYHLVFGRVLGPVEYGGLVSIFSILYISSIIPLSSSFAIVKFISSAKSKKEQNAFYGSIKRFMKYVAFAGLIIFLVMSPSISNFLHLDNRLSVAIVGPILFINLLALVNMASLQGLIKFKDVVFTNLISNLTKLLLGLFLVYIGYSLSGAMFAVLIGASWAYYYSKKSLLKEIKEPVKLVSIKPFLKYAFPVLIQALAFTSIFTVDVILVKHYLPPFEAGLYAALSTLGKIIYFAAQPVSSVMFPIVAGRKSKGEKFRHVFIGSFAVTALISIVIVSFYYLFPNLTIGLLYGSEYLMANTELVWMGIFISIYTVSYMIVNFLLSIGKTRIVALPLVISLLQVVALVIWHSSLLQVIQVSLSLTVVLLISLLVYLSYYEFRRIYVPVK